MGKKIPYLRNVISVGVVMKRTLCILCCASTLKSNSKQPCCDSFYCSISMEPYFSSYTRVKKKEFFLRTHKALLNPHNIFISQMVNYWLRCYTPLFQSLFFKKFFFFNTNSTQLKEFNNTEKNTETLQNLHILIKIYNSFLLYLMPEQEI